MRIAEPSSQRHGGTDHLTAGPGGGGNRCGGDLFRSKALPL